jgi:hypothetical protein
MPTDFSTPQQIALGLVLLLVLVAPVLLWTYLKRPGRGPADSLRIEKIDVSKLGELGPPATGPSLEYYHVPVRLALLVLAPVGREGRLPPSDELPELVDQLIPGLMAVLKSHQPEFRRWPPQLSSDGFVQALFSHVSLPGDHGKGTPWCSIAGRFETEGGPCLAGMVCRAATRNSLGQLAVEHSGKWLDVLRVRLK